MDFLVTKHGLAAAMQSDKPGFASLHLSFLDRLLPICAEIINAAVEAGELQPDVEAFELMYGVGNLCAGAGADPRYDARRMVKRLLAGLCLPSACITET